MSCPDDQYCASCVEDKCVNCYASYLEDGKCVAVTEENSLDNCLSYLDATTCRFCQHGYRVENGKCVEVTVEDCAESALEEVDGV